jgi:hypothetical protein
MFFNPELPQRGICCCCRCLFLLLRITFFNPQQQLRGFFSTAAVLSGFFSGDCTLRTRYFSAAATVFL